MQVWMTWNKNCLLRSNFLKISRVCFENMTKLWLNCIAASKPWPNNENQPLLMHLRLKWWTLGSNCLWLYQRLCPQSLWICLFQSLFLIHHLLCYKILFCPEIIQDGIEMFYFTTASECVSSLTMKIFRLWSFSMTIVWNFSSIDWSVWRANIDIISSSPSFGFWWNYINKSGSE